MDRGYNIEQPDLDRQALTAPAAILHPQPKPSEASDQLRQMRVEPSRTGLMLLTAPSEGANIIYVECWKKAGGRNRQIRVSHSDAFESE
jgi:hypothetical protein